MISSIESILNELNYSELIEALSHGFASEIQVPERQHYQYLASSSTKESSLLIMPAWENKKRLGVKIVTVSPENSNYDLPALHGVYILFDAKDGRTLMQFDAKSLTASRTACASALASTYLSRENSTTLLMIGSGALAPHLIKAHCSVRPIATVYIWNHNPKKAKDLASSLSLEGVSIIAIEDLDKYIATADIISSATLSETPLISGELIQKGTHIDLVGAYQKNMREADDIAIERSSVYVDTFQGMKESGDIAIPLEKGIINKKEIMGDLFSLGRKESKGRKSSQEITLFKSVGHALEDLVAANFFFEKIKNHA